VERRAFDGRSDVSCLIGCPRALSRAGNDNLQNFMLVGIPDVAIADIFAALEHHDAITHGKDIDQAV
jgi:hypothetical protein